MKRVLGLDLGTNSIGCAVINAETKSDADSEYELTGIEMACSRIIPMDAALLGNFDKGNSVSQTAERTRLRGHRRLTERSVLRRERLNRVLDVIGFLPPHYSAALDRYGKFVKGKEPKLAWREIAPHKFEFIFQDAFQEMIADFREHQPQLFYKRNNGEETKIPYDWTIYYLRNKALTKKVSKEELAWILLNFNQKRGCYQLRGEDEETEQNKIDQYYSLKVTAVNATVEKKGDNVWYEIHLANGWHFKRPSAVRPEWEGKIKDFIITTFLEKDGTLKKEANGEVKRSFRAPKDDDWNLLKKKTEFEIKQSHKTVGAYIYEAILNNPSQKIRGRLVGVIERKFYKYELDKILQEQIKYHPEFQDRSLYERCLDILYTSNDAFRASIDNRDLAYLLLENIIFYQRKLKHKNSLIKDCPYEARFDKEGNKYPVKCIATSNPLFQEFRLWQFISNLRIYEREKKVDGKLLTDVDVTNEFISTQDDYAALFDWLNNRADVEQNILLGSYFKIKKQKGKDASYPYRWNYVENKKYPCNETRTSILKRMSDLDIPAEFLSRDIENELWHILYSIDDKIEIEKALQSFARRYSLCDKFVQEFIRLPVFKREYGAYSAKAIGKLLPLMRAGRYWHEADIDAKTRLRIDKVINGEYDENIRNRVRDKTISLNNISQFSNLPLWLACYVVYDRHSEVKDAEKWDTPADIDKFIKTFKQHSLRNPIVEQVILETLRTVRDIWRQVGHIDEIHIELGREMKNTAEKRAEMTLRNNERENTNLRIKTMLAEFVNQEYNVENVRPYSLSQQGILRIYEEFAVSNLRTDDAQYDFISKVSKSAEPTKSEILRYKLWLEQKYRSPYTGEIIPLARLFTPAYEIEHVIPQSRYFDDSMSNKVICESEVNKLKDNALGYEFIQNNAGRKVELSLNRTVEIFGVDDYERFVRKNYANNQNKMRKLLLDDIPDDFINRQSNDSHYISKLVKSLLSKIVREDNEQEDVSKNVISCTGGITDRLKKDWGVNDVWNRIILPRFERMNSLSETNDYTTLNQQGHLIPNMPLAKQKGFNKKRIDHRHHAMDAIVIACATRNHINLLNNEAAKSKHRVMRYQLSRKLRRYEKSIVERNGERREIDVAKEFLLPWNSFASDVYTVLDNMIVSFKQNLRVINKCSNYYIHFEKHGDNNTFKKVAAKQIGNDKWAIRKPLHKDTFFGEVNLRKKKEVSLREAINTSNNIVDKELRAKVKEMLAGGYDTKELIRYFEKNNEIWSDINFSKIKVYYFTNDTANRYFATRKPIDDSYDVKKIENSITDTGIQKIMLKYLAIKENDPKLAFSPEGIEKMNQNIAALNDGVPHKPIYRVRWYECANKFAVGQNGNKSKQFVEGAKGTNLFFAVYETQIIDEGRPVKSRIYSTIPFNVAVDRQKRGLPTAPNDENGNGPIFVLSPNDLVYVPTEKQLKSGVTVETIDKSRIYKMVSSSGAQCMFIPHSVARPIVAPSNKPVVEKGEYGPLNKSERALSGEMIKDICIPIKVDRLGNIIES